MRFIYQAIYNLMEERSLFKEGIFCLIRMDSLISNSLSLGAASKTEKLLKDIGVWHCSE